MRTSANAQIFSCTEWTSFATASRPRKCGMHTPSRTRGLREVGWLDELAAAAGGGGAGASAGAGAGRAAGSAAADGVAARDV